MPAIDSRLALRDQRSVASISFGAIGPFLPICGRSSDQAANSSLNDCTVIVQLAEASYSITTRPALASKPCVCTSQATLWSNESVSTGRTGIVYTSAISILPRVLDAVEHAAQLDILGRRQRR